MKLDVSKIEGFAEMSDADKLNALLGMDIDIGEPQKPSNDEAIKLKNALNKATAEAADFKRQLREKQSEAEREAADRAEKQAQLEAELAEMKRSKSVADHQASFLSVGYEAELATKAANAIVDGDFATVFNTLKVFLEGHDKVVKAEILKNTPSPVVGSTGKADITKEQFAKMGYSERVKLFKDNPDLYAELNK